METYPVTELYIGETWPNPAGTPEIRANIAANVESGLPAWAADRTPKGRVAIVGYGPSLLDTWERLRDFDVVWTVSKAHDFLVERGISPTYHTDADYREHKAHFNARPSPGTVYVLATQVHPLYLERHAGADMRLFHICSNPANGPFSMRYPRVISGHDAGQIAAKLAFDHGHREQHWFGMDGSRADRETHAGPHSGVKAPLVRLKCEGREWESDQHLSSGLFFTERLLCKYPFLRATIHGGGLLGPFLRERGKCAVVVEP